MSGGSGKHYALLAMLYGHGGYHRHHVKRVKPTPEQFAAGRAAWWKHRYLVAFATALWVGTVYCLSPHREPYVEPPAILCDTARQEIALADFRLAHRRSPIEWGNALEAKGRAMIEARKFGCAL